MSEQDEHERRQDELREAERASASDSAAPLSADLATGEARQREEHEDQARVDALGDGHHSPTAMDEGS